MRRCGLRTVDRVATSSVKSPTGLAAEVRRHLSLAVAAGADALRRHEGWSEARVRSQLLSGLGSTVVTEEQRELLDAQVDGFAEGDLEDQIDLIDPTFEPSRVL